MFKVPQFAVFGFADCFPGVRRGRGLRGFTLIELIMVLVLMGVLAAFAVPRIMNADSFLARGFHDETLAYLRYAHKTAISQRRTVCVAFGANSLTLTIANAPAVACNTALSGPGNTAQLIASGAVVYGNAPAPISFNFNGLGQPVNAAGAAMATQTFQVATVARNIIVESVTGYVHE